MQEATEKKKNETWDQIWERKKQQQRDDPDSIEAMANYRVELDRAREDRLATGRNHKDLRGKSKKDKKDKKDKKKKKKFKKKDKDKKRDKDSSSSSDEERPSKRKKADGHKQSGGYGETGVSLASAFFADDSDDAGTL